MHRFFGTKYIFGYGPAFIAVAAEELQNPWCDGVKHL